MTENKINITDMIKALKCVASQDAEGDCYCDHFNAHLTCEQFADNARLDEKHMSCGGILKDTQSCPYSQKTYGVCYEDGELFWLKDVVGMLEEIQQYRAIGTVEGYKRAVKVSKENYYLCAEYKARLKEYEAIGTIEEFKALKENSFFNFDSPVVSIDEKSYNKAIDECIKVIEETPWKDTDMLVESIRELRVVKE